jgi:hypothetical protein|tara:strand:+ start:11834 stop:11995 length:162 start_codon:yes stop_codon:yes gene_type:complete
MKAKPQTEVQREYDQRRRDEGLVRVNMWVPEEMKATLVRIADGMRTAKKEREQ